MIPGGIELGIVVALILLFFGPRLLPKSARSLGQATREFRRGREESDPED